MAAIRAACRSAGRDDLVVPRLVLPAVIGRLKKSDRRTRKLFATDDIATEVLATLKVHPRVCGETHQLGLGAMAIRGPSPRVRGNLFGVRVADGLGGSIPACAGKPVGGELLIGPTIRGDITSCDLGRGR